MLYFSFYKQIENSPKLLFSSTERTKYKAVVGWNVNCKKKLSNGTSRTNFVIAILSKISALLACTRTRQNGIFRKYARLARLANICQALLWGLARLVKFARVICKSREFGASSHCLKNPINIQGRERAWVRGQKILVQNIIE